MVASRSLEAKHTRKLLFLFSGLSGVAFAAWSLSRDGTRYGKLLATLEQKLLPEITDVAQKVIAEQIHGYPEMMYDAISGLSGMGAYLLQHREDAEAAKALQAVLTSLVYLAEEKDGLPHWHVPSQFVSAEHLKETYPGGYLNCGLAHGIPGPLSLLAMARCYGIEVPGIDEAITRIAHWLIAHRLEDEWGINWPVVCPAGRAKDPYKGARTAWCYGTPGVARALWLAGQALNRVEYCQIAIASMQAVYRQPTAVRRIDSPCFCHGIAGLLHITLRFANDTGNALFCEAASALSEQLLALYQPDTLPGYRHLETEGALVDHPWLLDGAAGITLVLLAASTSCEPAWDRLFLLA